MLVLHCYTSHHVLCTPPPPNSTCAHSFFVPSVASSNIQPSPSPHLISPLHLVTMQIYLSPHARKTGSSESATPLATVAEGGKAASPPHDPQAKRGGKTETRKTSPSFALNLQKTSASQNTLEDMCSYKSPIKSPSQYFQICY